MMESLNVYISDALFFKSACACRPQILGKIGMALSDFDSMEEAAAYADKEIELNCEEMGHKLIHEERGDLMLDKFYYVEVLGKKRTWGQAQERSLTGERGVKSLKELDDAKLGVAALGIEGSDASSSTTGMKVEHVLYTKMTKDAAAFKSLGKVYFYVLLCWSSILVYAPLLEWRSFAGAWP